MTKRFSLAIALMLAALVLPQTALPHAERPTESPPRKGPVPNESRPVALDHIIDVCQIAGECDFEEIQPAVLSIPEDNTANWEIRIWPGFYEEPTSRSEPHRCPDGAIEEDGCGGTYPFEHHIDYPNSQNLIAIAGRKNITIRGVTKVGNEIVDADRSQVVIDVDFAKHVGIRGDRADGLILRNFSMYRAYDHGVYVMDTDGFVIDNVYSGYSREYPFLTFANDYGLMKNCEAEGGGDGGLYPGGGADDKNNSFEPGHWSTEIVNCKTHHNVLGYSGTQGDNVYVHDSEFYDNALGLVSDSETDHPNYPENNLVLANNKFYNNNFNVYASDSDVKATVFDGFYFIPVGVGVFLASGNDNLMHGNRIYDNDRYGAWLASGEGLVIGPTGPFSTGEPMAPPFASSNNRFVNNVMYGPSGEQNGIDFAWDGFGFNNCWQNNVRDEDGSEATTDAAFLPPCTVEGSRVPNAGAPNLANVYQQAKFLYVDTDGDDKADTPICALYDECGVAFNGGPAPGTAKNLPVEEGGIAWEPAHPDPCGPQTSCG